MLSSQCAQYKGYAEISLHINVFRTMHTEGDVIADPYLKSFHMRVCVCARVYVRVRAHAFVWHKWFLPSK